MYNIDWLNIQDIEIELLAKTFIVCPDSIYEIVNHPLLDYALYIPILRQHASIIKPTIQKLAINLIPYIISALIDKQSFVDKILLSIGKADKKIWLVPILTQIKNHR